MEGTLHISSWGLVPTVCTSPHLGGPPHWSSCLELPLTSQAAQPRNVLLPGSRTGYGFTPTAPHLGRTPPSSSPDSVETQCWRCSYLYQTPRPPPTPYQLPPACLSGKLAPLGAAAPSRRIPGPTLLLAEPTFLSGLESPVPLPGESTASPNDKNRMCQHQGSWASALETLAAGTGSHPHSPEPRMAWEQ